MSAWGLCGPQQLGCGLEPGAPPWKSGLLLGHWGGAWAFLGRLSVTGRQFPRPGCETQWRQEVGVEVSQVEAGDQI